MKTGIIDGLIHNTVGVIFDSGELVADATSIVIDGLTGNIDEEYEIYCFFVRGGTVAQSYYLNLNGDTGTNYGRERLRATGATITGVRTTSTSNMSIGYTNASGDVSFSVTMLHSKVGRKRVAYSRKALEVNATAVTYLDFEGHVWNNTTDEITSMTISSSGTDGIGVGSRIIITKRVNSAWGMKTGLIEPISTVGGVWQKIVDVTVASYLEMLDSPDWDVVADSSDWTIDVWVKPDHLDTNAYIVAQHQDLSNRWFLTKDGGVPRFIASMGGVNRVDMFKANDLIPADAWTHVAVCKVGNEYGMFYNGTQRAYQLSTYNQAYNGSLHIARRGDNAFAFPGLIEEVRIQKSNVFGVTMTNGGSFNGSTAYLSAPDHADWDFVANNTDSYTISFFAKVGSITNSRLFAQSDLGNNAIELYHNTNVLQFNVYISGFQIQCLANASYMNDTKWHHIAVVILGQGSSKDIAIYKDGIQVGWVQSSYTVTLDDPFTIGSNGANHFNGSIDEFIVYKGNLFSATPNVGKTDTIVVPTSPHVSDVNTKLLLHLDNNVTDSGNTGHTITNTSVTFGWGYFGFTPPTAPHTPDANTKLLLHGDTFPIVDSANQNSRNVITNTNVTLDTTNKQFGAGSAAFNGSNAYLEMPDSNDWNFIANNSDSYTISMFVRISSITNCVFFTQTNNSTDSIQFQHNTSVMQYQVYVGGVTQFSCQANSDYINDTNWHHIALVIIGQGSSKDVAIYKDGNQVGWVQSSYTYTPGHTLRIGGNSVGGWLNGNIDDFRVYRGNPYNASPNSSKTDTITVPTSAHVADDGIVLLLHFDASPFVDSSYGHAITNYGVAVNSDDKVFGTGSMQFGGPETNVVTFDNLDGNTDVLYKITYHIATTNAVGDYIMRFNGDVTADHYYSERVYGQTATITAAGALATSIGIATISGLSLSYITSGELLLYAPSGAPRIVLSSDSNALGTGGTTMGLNQERASTWFNSVNNITSITILGAGATPIMTTGTRIEIYKLNL